MVINKLVSKKKDFFGIFMLVLVVLLPVILIKLLWGWIIPDIFPGAVEQGLITDRISWSTTIKLMIIVIFAKMFSGGNSRLRSRP